jgi:hypothetical protein
MKTKVSFFLAIAVVALVLASCGAGRSASCDAYGSVKSTNQSADFASK